MQQDKSRFVQRANELLADLQELESELDTADNNHALYFRTSQAIAQKRVELEGLRKLILSHEEVLR